MKKLMVFVLCLIMTAALAAPALAEGNAPVVKVSGNATITLAADTATLQVGVITRASTVGEAQKENAELMNAVLEAIYGVGVEEKDVITSQFNVNMMYDYSYDDTGRENRQSYYQVENMLNVKVRDLSQVGIILDAAMEAGANSTYGIMFSSTQENEAYLKALRRAVEDAQAKARVLAEAAGKELGELRLVDASQSGYFYGISNTYKEEAAARDAGGTAIVTGDVSVTASVVLEYELK